MRADRLLATLMLLQAHGRLPARALAERLEVSERTVHRDMEALSVAGVPVYAERGRHGGWALLDSYRTDLTGLTEAELRSVVIASAPAVLTDLGLGDAADRALMKLLAGLPEARRHAAETARGYLHVDPSGWRRAEDVATFLPTLELALRTARQVRIRYERAADRTVVERVANPLGLVAKGSVWYLVATVDGAARTYRVSRLRAATILDVAQERPADFDLAAYWSQTSAEFRAGLPAHRVVLRISPDAISRVRLGWRYATLESEGEPAEDGWITCTIRAESVDVAVECVLSLGDRVEILAPAELPGRVAATASAALARLGRPRAGSSAGDGADHPGHEAGRPPRSRR
jgi:predicted DNA-binding transcriptional regulator YafY